MDLYVMGPSHKQCFFVIEIFLMQWVFIIICNPIHVSLIGVNYCDSKSAVVSWIFSPNHHEKLLWLSLGSWEQDDYQTKDKKSIPENI